MLKHACVERQQLEKSNFNLFIFAEGQLTSFLGIEKIIC
jgi:hypothetical protein